MALGPDEDRLKSLVGLSVALLLRDINSEKETLLVYVAVAENVLLSEIEGDSVAVSDAIRVKPDKDSLVVPLRDADCDAVASMVLL